MVRKTHDSSAGFLICCFLLAVSLSSCLPDGDLCKWMNGRKYYIDVGESGLISVENATSLTKSSDLSNAHSQPQIPQRCSVELITCPSCHLEIAIQRLAIPTCSNDKTCRCDFLWIKESAYSKSGREYCGIKENGSMDLIYESKTKLVSVDFLYSGSYREAFVLQFTAKKNVYIYKGGYDYYQNNNSSGVIKSPNFPGGYPSDYSAEFILQNVDLSGFVQLIFTDFQLSLWSYVEIFDSNGTRIDVYNGNTFRPPAIISSGPTLTVKFQANDEYPSTGFQAKYTFVSYPEKFWINRPSTDCGGFVEDFGGAVTMMNMVPTNSLRAFDCIWLIRPRNAHVPETQISIRVAQFEEMGPKSSLTIRQGQHSDAPLLESVTTYQHHKLPRGQEFVVPATSGFYIRLIGYFTNKSHLAIIYTTFRYESCYAVTDFECENGRCIKSALRCDGFNHCGDGSDEASCYGANMGTAIPEDANWWRTLTPNYYFPKTDTGPGAGTNTLILVTSLAGLGMFVLTTVMILVKLHRQRHDDSISREILHTVSGDLDMEGSPSHQGASDLPLYDPPPSYEDVIKLYLPPPPPYSSINRGRTRTSRNRSSGVENRAYRNDSPNGGRGHTRRSRGASRAQHETTHPMILKVTLPEEVEPTSPIRSSPPRGNTSSDAGLGGQNINLPPTQDVLPTQREQVQRAGDLLCSSASMEEQMENAEDNTTCTSENVRNQFSSSHTHPVDILANGRTDTETVLSCECQGACSCQLIGNKNQVSRCSSDGKLIICNSNPNLYTQVKMAVSKKRSFKDMMQKDNNGASSSAIIPHPASMTITVRPPKSKRSERKANGSHSSNSDPSSPVTTSPPEYDSDMQEYEPKSIARLSHRRTSSGPSDLSSSLDCLNNSAPNSVTKAVSENQISPDAANLSQSNYSGPVLLEGLQHPCGLSSQEASSSCEAISKNEEKTILPAVWTNLWNPSKKRVEEQDDSSLSKLEKSWTACDTLPLLSSGSQQPVIIKFEDNRNLLYKTSESQTNPIETE